MRLELSDELVVSYGDCGLLKARPANGLDNINHSKDKIKVIFEGDNSYNPITIFTRDIVSINGKPFNEWNELYVKN